MSEIIGFSTALILTCPSYFFVIENCLKVGKYIHLYSANELWRFDELNLYYEILGLADIDHEYERIDLFPQDTLKKYVMSVFKIDDNNNWDRLEKRGARNVKRFVNLEANNIAKIGREGG